MGWKNGKTGFYLQKGRSFQTCSEALLGSLFRLVPKAKKDWSCTSTRITGSSNKSLTPPHQFTDIAYVVFCPKCVKVYGLSHTCYMSCRLTTPRFHHFTQTCDFLLRRFLFLIWYYHHHHHNNHHHPHIVPCYRPFLPGTPPEPAVIPTAQASSFTLQYFPYYVWCSKYSCLL